MIGSIYLWRIDCDTIVVTRADAVEWRGRPKWKTIFSGLWVTSQLCLVPFSGNTIYSLDLVHLAKTPASVSSD